MIMPLGQSQLEDPPFIYGMSRVTSYAECKEVLQSRDFVTAAQARAPFLGDTLLDIDGEQHVQRRRLESQLFTRPLLQRYEDEQLLPMVDRALVELVRGPDGRVRADLDVLIRTILHRMSASISGIDGVETSEQVRRFESFVGQIGAACAVDFAPIDAQPGIVDEGLRVRREFIDEFYQQSLERREQLVAWHREGRLSRDELPFDLLTLLLLHEDPDWPAGTILREVTGLYMIASVNTTMQEISHAVIHISDWLARNPQRRGMFDDPSFVRSVAHHTLRLHTTAPALVRTALRAVTLRSTGRYFEEGERVALILRLANRDADVFGLDNAVFDPERELPHGINPWALTFGAGRHQCIGKSVVVGLDEPASSASRDQVGDASSTATYGSMGVILSRLYAAGIELDPDDPPVYSDATFMDTFSRFPVWFSGL
jgi:cytochrome P450